MRIIIDYQGAQGASRYRGIGRYTRNFTHAFLRAATDHDCILALNDALPNVEGVRDEFQHLLPQHKIMTYSPLTPAHYGDAANDAFRTFSECMREAFFHSLAPDAVIHTTIVEGLMDDVTTSIGRMVQNSPAVAIFYDLIPLHYPKEYLAEPMLESWYKEKVEYFRAAKLLLSISEASKQEAIASGLACSSNVANIGAAVDSSLLELEPTAPSQLQNRFGLRRPYLLYVGSSDARKNLPRLIEAYALIPKSLRKGHHLVLAGSMPENHIRELSQLSQSMGLSARDIILTGPLADEDIVGLYRNAKGFVLPSYHEGFGLPVLEAMCFGVPTIAGNRSSLPEVLGHNEALFDPFSSESMALAIERLLTDDEFRNRLQTHMAAQVQRFSWQRTADLALEAIQVTFSNQHVAKATPRSALGTTGDFADLVARCPLTAPFAPSCTTPPRLYVDVTVLNESDSATGIQRVVRNVLRCLPAVCSGVYQIVPVYWCGSSYRYAERVARMLAVPSDSNRPLFDPRSGDIFLGLDLNFHIVDQAGFFARIRSRGCLVYFVVYDVLPILLPHCFVEAIQAVFPRWFHMVSTSDGLIGISQSVANEVHDLQQTFGGIRSRPLGIGWFHLGADFTQEIAPDNGSQIRGTLETALSTPSFLSVGTIEPRKGHDQVVDAFLELWKNQYNINLIIIGKSGWLMDKFVSRLKALKDSERRLYWFEDLSDAELDYAYSRCAALIAASHGEGFGLPIIEAFRHEKMVVARDLPVFREIGGDDIIYFTEGTPSSIGRAVTSCLNAVPNQHSEHHRRCSTWMQSATKLYNTIHDQDWAFRWISTPTTSPLATGPSLSQMHRDARSSAPQSRLTQAQFYLRRLLRRFPKSPI